MDWEILYYSNEVQETIDTWPVGIRAYYARIIERVCARLAEVQRRDEKMGAMKTHDEMLRNWRQDPEFVREYDSLAQEFALFDELLRARQEAGLTQAEVAKRMATQPSVVARLEAGGGRLKHSPSLATLQKYAEAVGCRLEIKMVRVPPQCA